MWHFNNFWLCLLPIYFCFLPIIFPQSVQSENFQLYNDNEMTVTYFVRNNATKRELIEQYANHFQCIYGRCTYTTHRFGNNCWAPSIKFINLLNPIIFYLPIQSMLLSRTCELGFFFHDEFPPKLCLKWHRFGLINFYRMRNEWAKENNR